MSARLPGECLRPENARIAPQSDGTFHWGGEVVAMFLPVAGPETFDAPHFGPVWANVVAWRPDAPGRWWLEVTDWPLLGWQAVESARFDGGPLVLHPTPAAWVASGGQGCCVLRWAVDPLEFFNGLEVTCANDAVERRLRGEIERWAPMRISRPRHAA